MMHTNWFVVASLVAALSCSPAAPQAQKGLDVICGAVRDDDAAAVLVAYADAQDALGLVLGRSLAVPIVETSGIPAGAAVLGPSPRVAYNRREASRILRTHGHDALVFVFAHELGHVIDYAQGIRFDDPHDAELSADTWGGCALGIRMGETSGVEQQMALMIVDADHPDPILRLQAMREGYGQCVQLWLTEDR